MATKPLTMSVPHQLGRQEAKRRLADGLGQVKGHLSAVASSIEDHWTDDRLDFRMVAVGQTVAGRIEVLDDRVDVEVELPWALGLLANKIKDRIQRQGTLLLERK